jgi:hypothetical protein
MAHSEWIFARRVLLFEEARTDLALGKPVAIAPLLDAFAELLRDHEKLLKTLEELSRLHPTAASDPQRK